jgi:ribokinase
MKVHVFGPAYLDRVLRVDRPLIDPESGPPLDLSVGGKLEPGEGLTLADPRGHEIAVDLPNGWPGPTGTIRLARALTPQGTKWSRKVVGVSWHDDLGGMGAGYAAALGGELTSALGPDDDPSSRTITDLLREAGVRHFPVRVADRPADWTLLVTSAEHGDKLPIGFRGCHEAVHSLSSREPCDLRVVASFPNRLAVQALEAPGARTRLFAPAWRNVIDSEFPIASFTHAIDILCCNRREWEAIEGRAAIAGRVALLAVTDGARGCSVQFVAERGRRETITLPAFPRHRPPRDTNRAGEAFASTLVRELLDSGWKAAQPARADQVHEAAQRGSAAAALVLDRERFGFPSRAEIDAALRAGSVGRPDAGAAAGLG